ncbi:sugar phosphate isomerase/epimerase family protein [uncultured Hoeflea sp.]|uniref:sugar phosphate isomerase/epimerase family protein n=1 Tax=uncultured Hoeflea sp. TaxID=538666 RepID=UPI00260DC13B|nr:sugar phosphate isomerase/epimerase family protein [uncultured Hoeflea sp.]
MNRRDVLKTSAAALAIQSLGGTMAMAGTIERKLLWAANVRNKSLDDRILAARVGGFDAMSIFPIDFVTWKTEGLTGRQIRQRYDDAGIKLAIIDPFVQWVPNFEIPAGYPAENISFIDHTEDDVFRMAEELEATQINIVEGLGQRHEFNALVDALGEFADRAGVRGLRLGHEPMPISSIATLQQGWDLVRTVDRPNLGLTFDTWHFWRAEPDHDLLRKIPGEKIFDVQMVDATMELKGDLLNDLLRHRLFAGEGDFDLVTTVNVLRDIGGYRSVGPELFSDALDALDAETVGRLAGENMAGWT